MYLRSVRVENFKCVQDSTPFSIGSVTSLVGKNEAGKTALLQALYKLNPDTKERADFDSLQEYPRMWHGDYEKVEATNPANVLTTIWDLSDQDREALAPILGPQASQIDSVTISKGYSNGRKWTIEFNEMDIVLFYQSSLIQEDIDSLVDVNTIAGLVGKLQELETNSPVEKRAQTLALLQKNFPKNDPQDSARNILAKRLPTFLYFGDYQTMPGQVPIDALLQHERENTLTEKERVFLALLLQAGTTPQEISQAGKFEELRARLESIENRISSEIFRYWTQNKHLKVKFFFESPRPNDPPPYNTGYIFRTRIENTRHGVTIGFDERSTGFVWFFSFLVWFSEIKRQFGDNLIILLDEPGLGLHAKAQEDLLRYIKEKLEPYYQVIYSAHSPFMIDSNNILSARTVEDIVYRDPSTGEEQLWGTKVGDDVLSTDRDTIFPLQAALGYSITQTLFVGEHTLLVEGPSELLYFRWFSNELDRLGRVGLDRRWVVSPAGGVDKVASFISLFGGNNLHVAVFTDYKQGDKQKVRSLRDAQILQQGHVFTADTYSGQAEADIEDVLGRPLYVALVNQCYALEKGTKIATRKPQDAPIRVVKEAEDHFALLPPEAPRFDHYTPSLFLTENTKELRDVLPLADALERFERLFYDLNSLLPRS